MSTSTGQSSTSRWPTTVSKSVWVSSPASIASCLFAVGQTWDGCSYVLQKSRQPVGIAEVLPPLYENGEIVGVVDVVTDAIDRVLSNERLEARIRAFTSVAAGAGEAPRRAALVAMVFGATMVEPNAPLTPTESIFEPAAIPPGLTACRHAGGRCISPRPRRGLCARTFVVIYDQDPDRSTRHRRAPPLLQPIASWSPCGVQAAGASWLVDVSDPGNAPRIASKEWNQMKRNKTAALVLAGVGVFGAAGLATSFANGAQAYGTIEAAAASTAQDRGTVAGSGWGRGNGGNGNSGNGGQGRGADRGGYDSSAGGYGRGSGQANHDTGIPAAVPGAQISAEVEAQLVFMVEEEKLARDIYALAMDDFPDARVFSNINRAESAHMAQVQTLLERYKVADPTVGLASGVFADDTLQELYDSLSSEVEKGWGEAVQAGVAVEVEDIGDLKVALKLAAPSDVTTVLENLLAGSQRHLAAFQRSGGTV